jgi:hypothetical protein
MQLRWTYTNREQWPPYFIHNNINNFSLVCHDGRTNECSFQLTAFILRAVWLLHYLICLILVLHCRSSDLEVFVVEMVLTSYAAAAMLPNELGLSELYKMHVQVIHGGQKLHWIWVTTCTVMLHLKITLTPTHLCYWYDRMNNNSAGNNVVNLLELLQEVEVEGFEFTPPKRLGAQTRHLDARLSCMHTALH